MKHSLHPQRLILAVLLLAALVSSVCAAEVRIGKDSIYCFSAGDFADPARGIYVEAVPSASTGTLCYGDRVLCAGDVLPVSVLGELELLPVSTGGQEAALCYCPIRGTALGEPAQVTIRIRSAKDAAPKADDAELETYKNIPNDGRLTGSDPEDTNLTFQLAEEPKRGKVELQENGSFVYTPAKNKVGEDSFTFTVTDAAGKLVATVDCRWILVDLTGGHIMREPDWTVENFWNETVEGELSLHTHRCKELTSAGECRASYSLCDLNGHINNAYYLDLACDALPPEVLQAGPVTFAAVNYHREIPMGDTVELLYAPSEEGWYVQGRHDGRTSFECYLKIGS